MAKVSIEDGVVVVHLSLVDEVLGLHGSFRIPLTHVTNAFVSAFEDLELQYKLEGINFGFYKSVGVFTNPQGLIFVDASGGRDCLVIDTRQERYPQIAVQLPKGDDPNALAHAIMQAIPDSGAVE
ncbi:MAG TPA: hypothetical protein VGN14_15905 [Candidatus Elarobacter sp.]|jgi:hypothetical protein